MKKINKYFSFESIDDFDFEVSNCGELEIGYYNEELDMDFWYKVWLDGRGYNIQPNVNDYDDETTSFDTISEMVENYIFVDGSTMMDRWNGALLPKSEW